MDELPEDNKIELGLIELRTFMNLEKVSEYSNIIEESLEQLQKPIRLYNFTDTDGKIWDHIKISLIRESGIQRGYAHSYIIELHKEFIEIVKRKGNFTELQFKYSQKFKSKYTIRLYEYLSHIKTLPFKKRKPLTIDFFNDLFNKNYKHMSKIEEQIKRSLKEIDGHTDLENITYEKNKYHRTIKFKLDYHDRTKEKQAVKVNKKTRQESIEEGLMIDNILKKVEEREVS